MNFTCPQHFPLKEVSKMNQILCIGSVNLDHTYQVPHRPARRDHRLRRLPPPLGRQRGGSTRPSRWPGGGGRPPGRQSLRRRSARPWRHWARKTALTPPSLRGCASPPATPLSRWTAAGRTASSSTPGPTPPWTAVSSPPRWPPSARETCFSSRTRSATCPAYSAPPGPGG